jgi:hypothetical protein
MGLSSSGGTTTVHNRDFRGVGVKKWWSSEERNSGFQLEKRHGRWPGGCFWGGKMEGQISFFCLWSFVPLCVCGFVRGEGSKQKRH